MRPTVKILSASLVLIISFNFMACSKVSREQVKKPESTSNFNIGSIKLPNVTIMCQKDNSNELFEVENSSLSKIGDFKNINILDFIYDKDKDIYVFLINKPKENSLVNQEIDIKTSSKNFTLRGSSVYSDIKISPDSKKIAFRSFKDKALNEPEGLRLYDINSSSEIKLKSNVLVSGSVYEWLDDNNIIYYGIMPESNNSNKIYKYNLSTKEETTYFDKLEGYCLNVFPVNNEGILFLENNDDLYRLCYYDIKSGEKKLISESINEMSKVVMDKEKGILYFIGRSISTDNFALFSVNLSTFEFSQLTYDLPKNVDIKGGLALDKEGNILFCGTDSGNDNDVYIYDVKNNSTNLITEVSDVYKIFKDN